MGITLADVLERLQELENDIEYFLTCKSLGDSPQATLIQEQVEELRQKLRELGEV